MHQSVKDYLANKEYILVEELGRGSFGICYSTVDHESKKYYACKIGTNQNFQEEISIHSKLTHKNLVQFISSFRYEDLSCILMELCSNGTLEFLLNCRKQLKGPEVRHIGREIVQGLQYLHNHLVIHRDLKLENVFLTSNMIIKIGDFGLSTQLEYQGERRLTFCGTNQYIAPEILEKRSHGTGIDIWALGCIIYALIVGKSPFAGETDGDTETNIKYIRFGESKKIDKQARSFFEFLFVANPQNRPTANTVLLHPYFTTNFTLKQLPWSVFFQKYTMPIENSIKTNQPKKVLTLRDRTNLMSPNVGDNISRNDKVPRGKENLRVEENENKMTLRPRKVADNSKILRPPLVSITDNCTKFTNGLLKVLLKLMKVAASADWQLGKRTDSFLFVNRWVAGLEIFAYQLNDASVGVHYADQYNLHQSLSGDFSLFHEDQRPSFTKFNHLDRNMKKTQEYVVNFLRQLAWTGPQVKNSKPVVVIAKKFFISGPTLPITGSPIVAFLLSNGSCQINFNSHAKFLINVTDNKIFDWTTTQSLECTVEELTCRGIPQHLREKLECVCFFLTHVVQNASENVSRYCCKKSLSN